MNFEPKGALERCIFIVRGSFNPPIFHPDWFSRHGILPGEEIEGLISEPKTKEIPELGITLLYGQHSFIVGSDQTIINFKSLKLIVTRDRFEIRCEQRNSFPLMLALLRKVFKILQETPVTAYGINFEDHVKFDDAPEKLIGKFFTRKEHINRIFGDDAQYGYTIHTHKANAQVTFVIQPSPILQGGLYIKVHFHYESKDVESRAIVNNVQNNFYEALKFTEKVISQHFGDVIARFQGGM